jgi:hypothetical protein
MFNSSTNRDEASDSARRGTILQGRQQDSCQKKTIKILNVNRGLGLVCDKFRQAEGQTFVSANLGEKQKRGWSFLHPLDALGQEL